METCCGSQLSSTWPLDIDLLIGLGVLGGALAVDIIFLNCAFNQPFFLAIRVSLVFLSHCLYPPSTCHCLMALFGPHNWQMFHRLFTIFVCFIFFLGQSWLCFWFSRSASSQCRPSCTRANKCTTEQFPLGLFLAKLSLASAGFLRRFVLNGQSRSARCMRRTRQRQDSRQLQCERN